MGNKRDTLIGPFGRRTALCIITNDLDIAAYDINQVNKTFETINALRSGNGTGYNVIVLLQSTSAAESTTTTHILSLEKEQEDIVIALSNDQQSIFYTPGHELTSFHSTLQRNVISDVHLVGMSEIIFRSALDAKSLGYETAIIHDAIVLPTATKNNSSDLYHKIDHAKVGWYHSNTILNPISVEPRVKAAKYMQEKHINSFVEYLCAQMFFHQPSNPRQFLVEHIQTLYSDNVDISTLSGRSLLETKDFERIFYSLNVRNENAISGGLLKSALTELSMDKQAIRLNDDQHYTMSEFTTICVTVAD